MFEVIIVGAGYVGLTLGVIAAESGHRVVLVETDETRLKVIKSGRSHFYEPGIDQRIKKLIDSGSLTAHQLIPEAVNTFDKESESRRVYIITLGTPYTSEINQNYLAIESVMREVAEICSEWDTVIMRSTVSIGTSKRISEQFNNLKHISFCPERTVEGEALKELRELPQIIGFSSIHAKKVSEQFFLSFSPSVIFVSSNETAEAVKLVSNTFRDLNFALSNAIALLGKEHNFSALETIKAANNSYKRNNIPVPGPVGGPCLEKDPLILYASSADPDTLNFIKDARKLNRELVRKVLADWIVKVESGFKYDNVLVCGLAFKGKPLTNDTRGSLAHDVVTFFKELEFEDKYLIGVDPIVETFPGISEVYREVNLIPLVKSSIVIICTNHDMFQEVDFLKRLESTNPPTLTFWEYPKLNRSLHRLSYSLSEGSPPVCQHKPW
jgi:UDP-N-acetyl-D-mannosaminuronic acid dehydrogenase